MALAEAFELGRRLVGEKASPDDIVGLHHEAMLHLATTQPLLPMGSAGGQLTLPLLELTMAHGMVFREQMEQKYQALVSARLEQSSRLEAVGTLAAGIAHDFNNILGSVVGYAEMTEDAFSNEDPLRHNLRQIVMACARAQALVARMLAFARQTSSEPVLQELDDEMYQSLALLAPTLSNGIELVFLNHHPGAQVLAAPGHIQQIVMNLCINAAEAMGDSGELTITLTAAADEWNAPKGHDESVCICVSDTGSGMPPEVQARAFDPFFSTKAPKGSGLGLSVTHGIVQQLGGDITIFSRSSGPKTGTQIRVYLPCLETGREAPCNEEGLWRIF
ncbi:MAG TPA: ATP-binding protein [Rhodocyclaceae bacterium]|nr:ATP-binding protein [Rhodocyclaceae bacterium]